MVDFFLRKYAAEVIKSWNSYFLLIKQALIYTSYTSQHMAPTGHPHFFLLPRVARQSA
jgi:hypothetical protein